MVHAQEHGGTGARGVSRKSLVQSGPPLSHIEGGDTPVVLTALPCASSHKQQVYLLPPVPPEVGQTVPEVISDTTPARVRCDPAPFRILSAVPSGTRATLSLRGGAVVALSTVQRSMRPYPHTGAPGSQEPRRVGAQQRDFNL